MTHTALLKRFNELAAKATPGKWHTENRGAEWPISVVDKDQNIVAPFCGGKSERETANCRFIAVAPELLTLANAQAADIAELVAALKVAYGYAYNTEGDDMWMDKDAELIRALLERIGHE